MVSDQFLLGIRISYHFIFSNIKFIQLIMRRRKVNIEFIGNRISEKEEKRRRMYGELVRDIMNETGKSWSQSKLVLKERMLDRQLLSL